MKHRILSMTLAICMLLSLFPTVGLNASAYEETDQTDVGTVAERQAFDVTDVLQAESAVLTDEAAPQAENVLREDAPESKSADTRGSHSDTDVAYPVEGGNIYFNKETGTVTDCDESVTSADIPAEIDGVAVTSIGNSAFYDCTSLASVTIPDSVTSIGDEAFYKCWGLTSITIPDSVTSIGYYAFYLCENLKSMTIPASVTSIDSSAFNSCDSLTGIWVDKNNRNYSSDEYGVLFDKNKTTLVIAPKAIVGKYAIPHSVTSIGESAFYGCKSLTSITIPDSVTSIGWFAFSNTALYNNADNWTDGVLYIDNWLIETGSISGDYSVLGGTVGIADYAFHQTPSLESITIPDSVTNIGCHALDCFQYMRGVCLKGIWVDENNQSYSSDSYGVLFNKDKTELIAAPNLIDSDYKVPDGVESIADYAFADCISLYSIFIPDSVKTIGVKAFDHCYNMRGVVVGAGVTNIGDRAFFDCEMLCSLFFLGDAPQIGNDAFVRSDWGYYFDLAYLRIYYLDGKEGYPLSEWDADRTHVFQLSGNCGKDGDNLKWSVSLDDATLTIIGSGEMTSDIELGMPWGEFVYVITDIILPKGLTNIASGAFSGFGITEIVIPDTVTSVGEDAFMWCGLTSIIIPNSVESIGDTAFWQCNRMEKAIIGDGVTSIGDGAFNACSKLKNVYFLGDAPQIGENVFSSYYVDELLLYYIDGKEGWTTPEWNGYRTAVHTHTYNGSLTEATCVERGYTTYTCPDCGDSYVGDYVAALGHDYEDGKCTRCGEADPNATHTHSYTSKVTSPTCTAKGYTTYTCSCGKSYKDNYKDALGHNYKNGKCTRCGKADPNASSGTTTGDNNSNGNGSTSVSFKDVAKTAWYKEAVDYAVANGLMNGMGNNKFEPDTATNRAMLVTILWRYAGSPVEGKNTFKDVKSGQWFTEAVTWAAKNGIVTGVGNNKFDPEGKLTREQLATILFRYSKQLGLNTSARADFGKFADGKKVQSWSKEAVQWAVAEGIIGGTSENGKLYLDPQGNATRAQVATILMRFIENVLKK